jgi:hypothetical protein
LRRRPVRVRAHVADRVGRVDVAPCRGLDRAVERAAGRRLRRRPRCDRRHERRHDRRHDRRRGPGTAGGANSAGALPAPNGNSGLGSLPAGFPLPDGTTLGRIAVRSTDITAPMEVPDGAKAAVFWRKQLPTAGYKISSAVVTKSIGEIKFIGNGANAAATSPSVAST